MRDVDLSKYDQLVLNVANHTQFTHLIFSALDTEDELNDVVLVKAAYSLKPISPTPLQGPTLGLEPAYEATTIAVVDEFFGARNKSSVRLESDLAPHKPKCDVILIGSAHSPSGRPVRQILAGVDVDDRRGRRLLSHHLMVHGPRFLQRRTGVEKGMTLVARSLGADPPGWVLSEPEPFTDMPLRYEAAFGGELRINADDEAAERVDSKHRLSEAARDKHPDGTAAPIAHTVCRLNPVGRGFLEQWHVRATRATRYAAPRIERPDAPLTPELVEASLTGRAPCGSHPALTPQGFGVVTKAWQPRLRLAGTFDADWQARRAPFLPKNFDTAYWNCAHASMQCEHLKGGEAVTLTNLIEAGAGGVRRAPSGAMQGSFRLPCDELVLSVKFPDGRGIFILLPIDTLVIDTDSSIVQIAWRLRVPGGVPVEASLWSFAELRKKVREAVKSRE